MAWVGPGLGWGWHRRRSLQEPLSTTERQQDYGPSFIALLVHPSLPPSLLDTSFYPTIQHTLPPGLTPSFLGLLVLTRLNEPPLASEIGERRAKLPAAALFNEISAVIF